MLPITFMAPVTWSNLPIYALSPILLAVLAAVMLRKGKARVYPYFFAYLCLRILRSAVLLPLALHLTQSPSVPLYHFYFYFYWYTEAVLALCVFITLYKIFSLSFSRYPVLSQWTSVLFWLSVAACLAISIFVTPAAVRGRGFLSILEPILQNSMLLRTGILGFLFLFLFVFGIGISARDFEFGITLGLGLNGIIVIANLAVQTLTHVKGWYGFAVAENTADFVATAIWMLYLFVPQRTIALSHELPDPNSVHHWKDALSGFLRRLSPTALHIVPALTAPQTTPPADVDSSRCSPNSR